MLDFRAHAKDSRGLGKLTRINSDAWQWYRWVAGAYLAK